MSGNTPYSISSNSLRSIGISSWPFVEFSSEAMWTWNFAWWEFFITSLILTLETGLLVFLISALVQIACMFLEMFSFSRLYSLLAYNFLRIFIILCFPEGLVVISLLWFCFYIFLLITVDKDLPILLIFSKNPFLVSLLLKNVFLVSISFISALIMAFHLLRWALLSLFF